MMKTGVDGRTYGYVVDAPWPMMALDGSGRWTRDLLGPVESTRYISLLAAPGDIFLLHSDEKWIRVCQDKTKGSLVVATRPGDDGAHPERVGIPGQHIDGLISLETLGQTLHWLVGAILRRRHWLGPVLGSTAGENAQKSKSHRRARPLHDDDSTLENPLSTPRRCLAPPSIPPSVVCNRAQKSQLVSIQSYYIRPLPPPLPPPRPPWPFRCSFNLILMLDPSLLPRLPPIHTLPVLHTCSSRLNPPPLPFPSPSPHITHS
ncbi:hypothetical protein IWX46DRAFT_426283 [Phyllosticta citricarpa]|uniref:Uncharacterized protein n=1 Tax=Phyllosticta citricarpa TaxID=55181 RepID=A0ABR1MJA4_9PEZI